MKDHRTLELQMARRGWTLALIEEAVRHGPSVSVINKETGSRATPYIHPVTGRSVVVDDPSGEVLQVGGDDFRY